MRFEIIGVVFFVVAAVLFGWSGVLARVNNALYRQGKRTNALITDVTGVKADDGDAVYTTTLKYNVNGKDYTPTLAPSKTKYGEKDALVTVLYMPSDPARFEVYQNTENEKKARTVTIIAAISAVIGVVCIIIHFAG